MEYRELVGLPTDDGPGLVAAVADHWRWAIWRHGPCAQGGVTRHLRSRLEAAGVEREQAKTATARALEALLDLGDIARARSSHGIYLVPVEPRMVPLGDETSALIGTLPTRLARCELRQLEGGVARFFSPRDAEVVAALQRAGAVDWPLRALVGTPEVLRRAWGSPTGEPSSLEDAWPALVAELSTNALPVPSTERLRVVAGAPGSYFGSPEESNGRWSMPLLDGAWVGVRPGQVPGHHIPILALVEDGAVSCVDLADDEERQWALVARGVSLHAREVAVAELGNGTWIIQCTFWPPRQVRRLLSVCGARTGTWRWEVHLDALENVERALVTLGVSLAHPPR